TLGFDQYFHVRQMLHRHEISSQNGAGEDPTESKYDHFLSPEERGQQVSKGRICFAHLYRFGVHFWHTSVVPGWKLVILVYQARDTQWIHTTHSAVGKISSEFRNHGFRYIDHVSGLQVHILGKVLAMG